MHRKTFLIQFITLALAAGASAQVDPSRRISPAGTAAVGDVQSGFQISADGGTVVYRANQDSDGVYELYSVAIGGGASTKLNGALVPGGVVQSGFQVSADGGTVVYRADQDSDNVTELYSVAIGGGAAIKLNSALPVFGDVFGFQVNPDGSVLFVADELGSPPGNNLYISRLQTHWSRGGGLWSEAGNWSGGQVPGPAIEAVIAVIAVPAVVRVLPAGGAGSIATAGALYLGGGSGTSTIELSGGARIAPGAVLGGDGLLWMGGESAEFTCRLAGPRGAR
ncbi:MAG: hypothetical protein VCA55_05865 [Verrucomicrobiales bacterium]